MGYPKWIKPLFLIAALYDGILGVMFLSIPLKVFALANVAPPNHIGYVQFPACLLIIFALMFFRIAEDPFKNRDLIIYGVMLKTSYCAVIFLHWIVQNIPLIWVPFAFFDLAFLVIFMIANRILHKV
ncbi:MAG: hypothetical protein ABIA97_02175 [Candidatus Omnitrophota bacterium]